MRLWGWLSAVGLLLAQVPGVAVEPPAAATGEAAPASEGDAATPVPQAPTWLAIEGGTVHTVSGPVLRETTVLVKDGKIHAIGSRVQIPESAERVDARGHHVYPGLIAVRSRGLVGERDPQNSTDVFSLNLTLGLAGGLTTVMAGNVAVKLTAGTLEGHVIPERVFEPLEYRNSRPEDRRRVREGMTRVAAYRAELAEYEREKSKDPQRKAPDKGWLRGEYSKYLDLIEGRAIALGSATTWAEITGYCELAQQFGFALVLDGAEEGWAVAAEMARAGVGAIITPRIRRDPAPELIAASGSCIENAARLHEGGVVFAVVPQMAIISLDGRAGRDLFNLPFEAAFAVRGGLPPDVALRSITLDAARVLGLDRRLGSIEVGKDADFAVVDGDLLHYQTLVRWTIVNGRIVYDRMKDTLLDHIRPPADPNAPPMIDGWPRDLGEEF
ncbi:MAG: amidohydrolase family protein [Planctomycetota bacterium]